MYVGMSVRKYKNKLNLLYELHTYVDNNFSQDVPTILINIGRERNITNKRERERERIFKREREN